MTLSQLLLERDALRVARDKAESELSRQQQEIEARINQSRIHLRSAALARPPISPGLDPRVIGFDEGFTAAIEWFLGQWDE